MESNELNDVAKELGIDLARVGGGYVSGDLAEIANGLDETPTDAPYGASTAFVRLLLGERA